MSALVRHLAAYGAYHRDRRNIATHMVGVPMIVFAVVTLLSRPALTLAPEATITPAMLLAAAAALFYLWLDLRFGMILAAMLAATTWAGLACAAQPSAQWLAVGTGTFAAGWAIQFLGHAFEGRKPAFLDDLSGLIVAPLFLVAEMAFLLGLRRELGAALSDRT